MSSLKLNKYEIGILIPSKAIDNFSIFIHSSVQILYLIFKVRYLYFKRVNMFHLIFHWMFHNNFCFVQGFQGFPFSFLTLLFKILHRAGYDKFKKNFFSDSAISCIKHILSSRNSKPQKVDKRLKELNLKEH